MSSLILRPRRGWFMLDPAPCARNIRTRRLSSLSSAIRQRTMSAKGTVRTARRSAYGRVQTKRDRRRPRSISDLVQAEDREALIAGTHRCVLSSPRGTSAARRTDPRL